MSALTSALSGPGPGPLVEYPAALISTDRPWLFWRSEPAPALRRSLEQHGQLSPVLIDGSDATPVLIAGAGRVSCLRDLGRSVLCLDLGRLDAWARGAVYVQSNAGTEVSDGRLVVALRYFLGLDPGAARQAFELLGADFRSRQARLALAWLELPACWDELLLAGRLPLAAADLLRSCGPDDLASLWPLCNGLVWSRSNAVNVLTWLRETGARDGRTIGHLLEEAGVAAILAAGLSPKDSVTRIAAEVRRLRYPQLDRMERDFAEAARLIVAGTGWRLVQPDQFETNGVELTLRVTARTDLEQAAQALGNLAQHPGWNRVFPGDGQ